MNKALVLLFLFSVGSIIGWFIELFWRRFVSNRKTKKWVNPGFLTGPWLPLYGSGLCALYLLASIHFPSLEQRNPVLEKIIVILFMAAAMTLIEYITGVIFIKRMHVMLWDYSHMWGNIQGIICPLFSFFWAVLGAVYFLLIHPRVLTALDWLSRNLAFSFFIGLFYGIFIMDCVYSFHVVARLKAFADEYQVIVRYNDLKEQFADLRARAKERSHFFLFFSTQRKRPDQSFDLHKMFEQYKDRFSISRFRQNLADNIGKAEEKYQDQKEEFQAQQTVRREESKQSKSQWKAAKKEAGKPKKKS